MIQMHYETVTLAIYPVAMNHLHDFAPHHIALKLVPTAYTNAKHFIFLILSINLYLALHTLGNLLKV